MPTHPRPSLWHRIAAATLTPIAAATIVLGGLAAGTATSIPAGAAAAAPTQGWTTTEAPLPADSGNGSTDPHVYIASSACMAQNACVIDGWYDDTGGRPWGLIEMQNGTSWTDIQAPQPSNAGSGSDQGLWLGSSSCGLQSPCDSVSCPSTAFCVASGEYLDTSGNPNGVIETFAGGTWTALQAPVPSDHATSAPVAYLTSVACTSTTSCVAVGVYKNTSNQLVGLVETLSPTGWTPHAAAPPSDLSTTLPSMFLGDVSCSSGLSCAGVGFYNTTSGGTKGLIVTTSGGTLTTAAAPEPADAFTGSSPAASLQRVKCTADWSCVAVGGYQNTNGFAGLIETYHGGVWTPLAAPEPGGAATGTSQNAFLSGVSCGAPSVCSAVGIYRDSADRLLGLIDTENGGTWTALQAPLPTNAVPGTSQTATLSSVACPSPGFCIAVGSYITAATVTTGWIVTLSGGTWTGMQSPLPSNYSPSPTLAAIAKAVACYALNACVVGGFYPDPGNTQGFLDTYTGVQGYWLTASDGGVFTYGNAQFYGSTGNLRLNAPVVGMAPTADGQGYWLVASDGGIFNYGDAQFHGSAGALHLVDPVVGMAATPDGAGYWLVASDGGIFSYGDAQFYGSAADLQLHGSAVGMAATPDGGGYWIVASDGGIFSYGDAKFYGSTGNLVLNKPVVGMAATPTGLGYWLVASDGGIFNYGDAQFNGSAGNIRLNKPVVGMTGTPSGLGYWLVASDGGIFTYGDALFYGSTGNIVLNEPMVGMAG